MTVEILTDVLNCVSKCDIENGRTIIVKIIS